MLGAILAESSPPPYKEMTDKTYEPAPKKVPYFGDGGEVEFGQPKEVEADEGEEEEKMAEEFGLRFAKWWPFRLLKTLNLLLLLALLGLCAYNAVDYNRMGSFHWSKVWDDGARYLKYYDPFRLVTGLAILFLMAICSMWVHSRRSNSPGLAVMDICFALIIIVNLLYIGGFFGLRAYVEYRWFAPRLSKLHGTEDLVELAEWTPPHVYSSYSVHYYAPNSRMTTTPTTTTTTTPAAPTDRDWQMMRQRVDAIRTRLLLDPAIAILSLLAILVNASLAFAIWGSMKRSRLYANYTNAIGSRCQESPPPVDKANANGELEQAMASALDFARFWPIGFVKLLLTSITTVLCFLSIYGDIVPWQSRPFYHFFYGALGAACLANLVLYVQKVLLLFGGKKQQQKVGELNNFRKMDCLLNCVGALAFLSALMFDSWPEEFKYIYGLLIALFLVGPVRYLYLYKIGSQNCGGFKTFCGKDFELNMPLISIQVQINTGKCEKKKKEEEEEKDDGKVDGEEKIGQ